MYVAYSKVHCTVSPACTWCRGLAVGGRFAVANQKPWHDQVPLENGGLATFDQLELFYTDLGPQKKSGTMCQEGAKKTIVHMTLPFPNCIVTQHPLTVSVSPVLRNTRELSQTSSAHFIYM